MLTFMNFCVSESSLLAQIKNTGNKSNIFNEEAIAIKRKAIELNHWINGMTENGQSHTPRDPSSAAKQATGGNLVERGQVSVESATVAHQQPQATVPKCCHQMSLGMKRG